MKRERPMLKWGLVSLAAARFRGLWVRVVPESIQGVKVEELEGVSPPKERGNLGDSWRACLY